MTIAQRLTRFSLRTALVLMAFVAVALGIMRVPGRRAQHLANVLAAGDRDEITRLLGHEERAALPFPLCPMEGSVEWSEQELKEYSKRIKTQVDPPTAWQYLTCRRTVTVEGTDEGCELDVSFASPTVLSTWTALECFGDLP